jgi:L-rhamnose mutarotase
VAGRYCFLLRARRERVDEHRRRHALQASLAAMARTEVNARWQAEMGEAPARLLVPSGEQAADHIRRSNRLGMAPS